LELRAFTQKSDTTKKDRTVPFYSDYTRINRQQHSQIEFSKSGQVDKVQYYLDISLNLQLPAANKRSQLLPIAQFGQHAKARNDGAIRLTFPLAQHIKLAFAEDQDDWRRELLQDNFKDLAIQALTSRFQCGRTI